MSGRWQRQRGAAGAALASSAAAAYRRGAPLVPGKAWQQLAMALCQRSACLPRRAPSQPLVLPSFLPFVCRDHNNGDFWLDFQPVINMFERRRAASKVCWAAARRQQQPVPSTPVPGSQCAVASQAWAQVQQAPIAAHPCTHRCVRCTVLHPSAAILLTACLLPRLPCCPTLPCTPARRRPQFWLVWLRWWRSCPLRTCLMMCGSGPMP